MKENSLELLREQVKKEPFANHMGITLLDVAPGYAMVEARFSEKMNSFHGLIHGGAIFALIDVAFGAASNSHGTIALALNINITYIEPPEANSLLVAEAREESRTKRTATYHIEVLQKDDDGNRKIAICQALVYRKNESLPFGEGNKNK
jgi:acyl-CoA thioesterase